MSPPIFLRYCSAFDHMLRIVAFMVGIRYGGSSITKGVSSALNQNLRMSLAVSTAMAIPSV